MLQLPRAYTYLLPNLLVDDNVYQSSGSRNTILDSDQLFKIQFCDHLLDRRLASGTAISRKQRGYAYQTY